MENIEEDSSSTLLIDIEDTRCPDITNQADEDEIMAEEEEIFMHIPESEEISASKETNEETEKDYNNVEEEEENREGIRNVKAFNYFIL